MSLKSHFSDVVTRIAFYQTCLYYRYHNLYRNNRVVFITKQITPIQSNTTQVYLIQFFTLIFILIQLFTLICEANKLN
jgi:hypothetical protein